jgi:hypothetical protein
MTTLKQTLSPFRHVFWAAGAVLLLKFLFILTTPMLGLASTTWIIDDSFIEMRIARNIALGMGFSLDGIHSTTGAPFLWIYLTSLNHLFLGKDAAIRATMMESSLFGVLATIALFFIALKLTKDRRVAWTAFLLPTFTANAALNAMNGMETSFFTLLVLLSIGTFLGVGKPASWSPFRWGCITGLLLGTTVMTRPDGLFVIVSLVCVRVFEWWKTAGEERKTYQSSLLGMLLICGACFGLFMAWQFLQTGSLLPANQVGRRGLSLALHGFSFDAFSLPKYIKIVIWNVFQLEELLTIATGGSMLALAALVIGMLNQDLRKLGFVSAIYMIIFFTLLVAYQWYFPDLHGLRYINPAAHLLFIFVAALLWQLPIGTWKRGAIIFICVSVVVLASYKHYQINSRTSFAPYMSYIGRPHPEKNALFWDIYDWMQNNIPAKTIVGVRDYGRISMFTDLLVQDLAGNIAPDAAFALNDGTLDTFLKDRNVEYLFIPPLEKRKDYLYQYLHTNLNLERMTDAPESAYQNLYKIVW